MTRNHAQVTITMTRIDLCNLIMACTFADHNTNEDTKKWAELRKELKAELDSLDAVLDRIEAKQNA